MNVTFRLMNDGLVGPSETLELEDCADLEREGRNWATGQLGHPWDYLTAECADGSTLEIELTTA